MTAKALHCTACGVQGETACSCGKPYAYIPAKEAAALAVAAHPNWSDRKVAEAVGVSDKTIAKARSATADNSAVERRTGRDGRTRRITSHSQRNEPVRTIEPTPPPVATAPARWDEACDQYDIPQVPSGNNFDQAIFNFRYMAAMAHEDASRALAEIRPVPRARLTRHIKRKLIKAAREVVAVWTTLVDELEQEQGRNDNDEETHRPLLS